MPRSYTPHIDATIGELMDQLGFMILKSPTFEDPVFPGRNVESVFAALGESLNAVRSKLGEERFQALTDLSGKARAHFEADPHDANGEARAGRRLIYEMRDILERDG